MVKEQTNCHCGFQDPSGRRPVIRCSFCNKLFHEVCIRDNITRAGGKASFECDITEKFLCSFCRLENMDPFCRKVSLFGSPVMWDVRTAAKAIRMEFNVAPSLRNPIRTKQVFVQLRAVDMNSNHDAGPAWPFMCVAKINNIPNSVIVEAPKYLHNRREQIYDITDVIQIGKRNEIDIQIQLPDARNPEEMQKKTNHRSFLMGCYLISKITVKSLAQEVRNAPPAPADRYKTVLQRIKEDMDEVQVISKDVGHVMSFACPLSHSRIQDAAIGKDCVHLQVFDLDNYLIVNEQTKNLTNRWHCPVCNKILLPRDLMLDPFMNGILRANTGNGKVLITEEGGHEVVLEKEVEFCTLSDSSDDDDVPAVPKKSNTPVHALPRGRTPVPKTVAPTVPKSAGLPQQRQPQQQVRPGVQIPQASNSRASAAQVQAAQQAHQQAEYRRQQALVAQQRKQQRQSAPPEAVAADSTLSSVLRKHRSLGVTYSYEDTTRSGLMAPPNKKPKLHTPNQFMVINDAK